MTRIKNVVIDRVFFFLFNKYKFGFGFLPYVYCRKPTKLKWAKMQRALMFTL